MAKKQPTPADVRFLVDWLFERLGCRLDADADTFGEVSRATGIIFRYARMKFGSVEIAYSALGWWITNYCQSEIYWEGYGEDLNEWPSPQSRFGEMVSGMLCAFVEIDELYDRDP